MTRRQRAQHALPGSLERAVCRTRSLRFLKKKKAFRETVLPRRLSACPSLCPKSPRSSSKTRSEAFPALPVLSAGRTCFEHGQHSTRDFHLYLCLRPP